MTQPAGRGGPLDWLAREGNYDTSDVRTALAKLQRESPPAGAQVIELVKKDATTQGSGFFDRLLEEHFTGPGSFPRRLKDVTKSLFGMPGQEETITWGQSGDLSVPAGVVSPAILPLIPQPQMVHVHRDHPTTFTVLGVVDYGPGWTATPGEDVGIQLEYTLGVGQQRVTLKRTLPVVSGTALFNGAQQFDIITVPLVGFQAKARMYDLTLLGAETVHRTITVTILAAPVVQ